MDKQMVKKTTGFKQVPNSQACITIWKAGCFRFGDGTTQGWQLNQLYDTKTGNPIPIGTGGGFILSNSNSIALSASTNGLIIPKYTQCDFYFESPDLVNNAHWQKIAGFSLDVEAFFGAFGYNLCKKPGLFFLQLQMITVDSDGTLHTFAEYEKIKKQFIFHDIILSNPYHFIWKPNLFLFGHNQYANHKVKQVRVRCTTPIIQSGESAVKGSWLIGNVCPE